MPRGGFLTRGAVQAGRYTAGEAAEQGQLTAMMDRVQEELSPEEIADGLAVDVLDRAVEIGVAQPRHSRDRVCMHHLEGRSERLDGPGTLNTGRLLIEGECASERY